MPKSKAKLDPGLQRAVEAAGSLYMLAKKLGIKPASIYKWREVPVERLLQIEIITGVDRTLLRPELYRRSDAA